MSLFLSLFLLAIGFILLTKGADYFIDNSAILAEEKGIPPHVVGVTIVAFGTSLPELLVSIISSLQGYNDLALGNIVGSNISNIGLVLGTSCFIFFYLARTSPVPPTAILGCPVLLCLKYSPFVIKSVSPVVHLNFQNRRLN